MLEKLSTQTIFNQICADAMTLFQILITILIHDVTEYKVQC